MNQFFITIAVLSSIIAGAFSYMKDTGWRCGVDSVTMADSVTVCVCWGGGRERERETLNQLFITIAVLSSIIAGAFSDMKATGWRYGIDSVTMADSVCLLSVCVCLSVSVCVCVCVCMCGNWDGNEEGEP